MNPLPGIPLVESPFFEQLIEEFPYNLQKIARDIHVNGFSVIDFPDDDFFDKSERIKKQLDESVFGVENAPRRVMNAWKSNQDVRDIAANPVILNILSILYGRKAIPFQTLNFKYGSEQHYHSDAVHFNSSPERFMCGVWVPMEDQTETNGPLVYFPGSHTWPILTNEMIEYNSLDESFASQEKYCATSQTIYHDAWEALVAEFQCKPETFLAKKGQALIWAANLLHGGLPIIDKNSTRWSQVTHYFFTNCSYYTPMMSNLFLGNIAYRQIENIATGEKVPNISCGRPVPQETVEFATEAIKACKTFPKDFDAAAYLLLHEDVRAAGVDPREHWWKFGRFEGRKYVL